MSLAPLAHAVGVPITLEVVRVSGPPEAVAPELPGLATGRLVTIVLACAIAQVRKEWLAAVAADFLVF